MLFRVDVTSPVPIYRQLVDQLSFAIASGRVEVDERLPSARELAQELNINLHTVVKAYQHLVTDGLVEFRRGKGTFVARSSGQTRSRSLKKTLSAPLSSLCRDALMAGLSRDELVEFMDEVWRREERGRKKR